MFGAQVYKKGIDMESAVEQMSKHASGIKTVIDIGASNGRWSRMVMKYLPNSHFFAIDPLVEREPQLKRLKQNNSNFDYFLCAAGENEKETISLTVGDDLDGSTVLGKNGAMRNVPSYSIDSIVKIKNLERPFIIKFDTHGFEVPILKGAKETLKKTDYIIMEVYNYRHTEGTLLFYEMCKLLEELGFRCFTLADPFLRPLDNTFWQMDLFFAKKNNPIFHNENYK